jgi:PAS domain S-box-containing protein
MRWPHQHFSIRGKLMLVTLGTAGSGLLLACVAFMIYDLVLVRQTLRSNLTVLADVVANNSTASLQFQKPEDAARDLLVLRAQPQVIAAALYDQGGKLFARYSRATEPAAVPARVGPDGWKFSTDRLTVFRPVELDRKRIGTVYLHSDLSERNARVRLYVTVTLIVLAATFLVTLAVSARAQKIISQPILALARTAHIITESKNYSVRAERFSHDELGQLTDTFNEMLAAVETRDGRLRDAYNALVKENTDRQRAEEALRLDEVRLEGLLRLNQMTETPIDELTDFALQEAVQLTHSQVGWLSFFSPNAPTVLIRLWPRPAHQTEPVELPVAKLGYWSDPARQREPVVCNAVQADTPPPPAVTILSRKLTRFIGIPILDGDRLVARAGVADKETPYDDADLRQLTLLMQGMWRLIQRRRAEEELLRHRDHLEELVEERTVELKQANAQLAREVAERKAAEEAVRHERDRAQTYLDVAGAMLIVIGADQKVRLINRAGCALLGYAETEVVGRNWFDLFLPADVREKVRGVFHELMTGEEKLVEHYENAILTRTGEQRLIAWHNVLLRNPHGEIQGVISSGEDVTERRHAERRLRDAAAALARSNKELEQFAYVASHDLREPLRMVASYVQLLERRYRGQLDAEADQFIHFAVDGAKRMQALIDDLLQYARIETRAKPFAPVDCGRVLEVVLNNLQIAITEAHATVEVTTPLPTIQGDDLQLTQLFQNLIGNALKFRRPEAPPCVKIAAHLKHGEWVFSVQDNGIGIEPQHYERIFVIFQRLHTREEYAGTGIGLALCKKIIERHGGRIWVESVPGQGSTFCFAIPVPGEMEI